MGGWRYPAIKGHARPTFNHISILDASPSRATCCRGGNRTRNLRFLHRRHNRSCCFYQFRHAAYHNFNIYSLYKFRF